ncbi:MAG: hypothetical protein ACI4XJ_03730 [Eubacteriales bacterium]
MKRKISFLLCLLFVISSFSACSEKASDEKMKLRQTQAEKKPPKPPLKPRKKPNPSSLICRREILGVRSLRSSQSPIPLSANGLSAASGPTATREKC